MTPLAIGVDIGGTKIAAAVAQGATLLEHGERPTPKDDLTALTKAISQMLAPWLQHYGKLPIGICAPGLLEPKSGTILLASNIPAISGVALRDHLSSALGTPIQLENDANAAALAEYHYGAGQGWQSMVYATVSTGIGGGFIERGKLFYGSQGYATDIGHITVVPGGERCSCMARGCLEAYASGTAIARRASERYGKSVTTQQVFEHAAQKEPVAHEVIQDATHLLALGLATTAKILDPDGVVMGGGVSQAAGFFAQVETRLQDYLKNFRPVPLKLATFQSTAGVIGAAVSALPKGDPG